MESEFQAIFPRCAFLDVHKQSVEATARVLEGERLRRQLVERAPQHLVRQPVGHGDILSCHFDVFELPTAVHDRLMGPLVLVKQRQGANQGEVLQVVAPRPGLAVEEGQLAGVRVHDGDGLQQSLRITMQGENRFALPARQQAFQGLLLALLPVDSLRLLALFVHRQHETAIQYLLVQIDGGGREEEKLTSDSLPRCSSRLFREADRSPPTPMGL